MEFQQMYFLTVVCHQNQISKQKHQDLQVWLHQYHKLKCFQPVKTTKESEKMQNQLKYMIDVK